MLKSKLFAKILLTCLTTGSIFFIAKKILVPNLSNGQHFNLTENDQYPLIIPYPKDIKLNYINSVDFSTFQPNTLWINSDHYIEIDINAEKADIFQKKYNIEQYRPEAWNSISAHFDKTGQNLWFTNTTEISCYSFTNKTTKTYSNLGSFLTFFRDENHFWLGTTQGLFEYNEKSDNFFSVSAICNVSVNKIEKENNLLIINNLYRYDNIKNTIENIGNTYILQKYSHRLGGTNQISGTPQKPTLLHSAENAALFSYENYNSFLVINQKDTLKVPVEAQSILTIDDSYIWYNRNPNIASYNFKTSEHQTFTNNGKNEMRVPTSHYPNVVSSNQYLWYYNESILYCFDKKEKTYWKIYDLGEEKILNIKQDGENILVFGQDKMIIAKEKIWLSLKNSFSNQVVLSNTALDSFHVDIHKSLMAQNDILGKITVLEQIKQKYQNSPDTSIQRIIKDLSPYIYIDVSDSIGYRQARTIIEKNNPIPENYKISIYKGLIQSSALLGRVTLGSDFYKKMESQGLKTNDVDFERNVFYVNKARQAIDSIKSLSLTPDALLWGKACIVEGMLHNVTWNDGNYGDDWGDFTASNELYTELYKKYPKSEFAEKAEWKINGDCLALDTCGPPVGSIECINFCKDFLKRYPNTLIRANVCRTIIANYRYLDEGTNDRIKALKDGIAFAQKTLNEGFSQEAITNLKEMKEELATFSWELNASIPKTTFDEGEDIVVNVTLLKNALSDEVREIEYKTNTPNCQVELELIINSQYIDCRQYFRENLSCPNVIFKKKTMQNGQKISEKFSLLKNVRTSDFIKDGAFILPKGDYQMTVIWADLAKTDKISFVIE